MPSFWAHAELLATRIGEKPMSGKTATCARADQLNRRLGVQQMDLFGSPAAHGGNAPAWRELPSETQDVLVKLIVNGARNLPTCGGSIFPTWAGMVISP
jgi:hypothetical protein